MTQRAIAAEAALEAILQTPAETLQQEEVLTKMIGPLRKHGANFLNVGGGILSGILGIVGGALGIAQAKKKELQMNGEKEANPGHDQEFVGEAGEGKEALKGMDPVDSAEADFLRELENGI